MTEWTNNYDRAQDWVSKLRENNTLDQMREFLGDPSVPIKQKREALINSGYIIRDFDRPTDKYIPTPKLVTLINSGFKRSSESNYALVKKIIGDHSLPNVLARYLEYREVSESDPLFEKTAKQAQSDRQRLEIWTGTNEAIPIRRDYDKNNIFSNLPSHDERCVTITNPKLNYGERIAAMTTLEAIAAEIKMWENKAMPHPKGLIYDFTRRLAELASEVLEDEDTISDKELKQNISKANKLQRSRLDVTRIYQKSAKQRSITLYGRISQHVDYVGFIIVLWTIHQFLSEQKSKVFNNIQIAGRSFDTCPQIPILMSNLDHTKISLITSWKEQFQKKAYLYSNLFHVAEGRPEGSKFFSHSLTYDNRRNNDESSEFQVQGYVDIQQTDHKGQSLRHPDSVKELMQLTIMSLRKLEDRILADTDSALRQLE